MKYFVAPEEVFDQECNADQFSKPGVYTADNTS